MEDKFVKRIRVHANAIRRAASKSFRKGNAKKARRSTRDRSLQDRFAKLGVTGTGLVAVTSELDEVANICERYLQVLEQFADEDRTPQCERLLVELELALDHLSFHQRTLRSKLPRLVDRVYNSSDKKH